MALVEPFLGCPRWTTEQSIEAPIGHCETGAIVEVAEVKAKRTIRLHVDQVFKDRLGISRLAIGSEPHDLVLAGIDSEAQVISESRIEEAERMGKVDFLGEGKRGTASDPRRGGGPFA